MHELTYDIYFLAEPHGPRVHEKYEIVCTLEDGYAAFLERLFEEKDITTQEWVFFNKDNFDVLIQITATARQRIKAKGEQWNVSLGWRGTSQRKKQLQEVYSPVIKTQMNTLLDTIDAAVNEANSNGKYIGINFWGGGG